MMTSPLPLAPLTEWVERQLECAKTPWQVGHQGQLLRYRDNGWDLVIKCPQGRGVRGWWSRASLRREHAAYQRLHGVAGIPRCYGLLPGGYLVLEFIESEAFRGADIADRQAWFARLLTIVEQCHQRGVAHGDLKRKANLLLDAQGQAVVVDFGTAWLRKSGFSPLNQAIFRYLARTDINACIKHKYRGRYDQVSADDALRLRYSRLERWINRWRHWRERRRMRKH
ncbi:MAG: hypothetical protein MI750_08190 [Xanthomonadales bacterium]|nr:hypothetical protein [Xanthomonadales bacterium]